MKLISSSELRVKHFNWTTERSSRLGENMSVLSRAEVREREKRSREYLVKILHKLINEINGIFVVLFTHEGLHAAVYPSDTVDPLDASVQASAISGAVGTFTKSIGINKVNYLIVSGENAGIVIVTNEHYGLMFGFSREKCRFSFYF